MSRFNIKSKLILTCKILATLGVTQFAAINDASTLATVVNTLKNTADASANRFLGYRYKANTGASGGFNSFFDSYYFKGKIDNNINGGTDGTLIVTWEMTIDVDTQSGVLFSLVTQSGDQIVKKVVSNLEIVFGKGGLNFARQGRHNSTQLNLLQTIAAMAVSVDDITEEVEYFILNH